MTPNLYRRLRAARALHQAERRAQRAADTAARARAQLAGIDRLPGWRLTVDAAGMIHAEPLPSALPAGWHQLTIEEARP
jgi:hypothetical protein